MARELPLPRRVLCWPIVIGRDAAGIAEQRNESTAGRGTSRILVGAVGRPATLAGEEDPRVPDSETGER